MPKLTARRVAALETAGFYGDGEGLYLKVGKTGGKSWILRTVVQGRRRDLGLGSASLVPLSEARLKAREYRKTAREGGDPDALRKPESLSFSEAAERVHAQLRPTWRNQKHAETWLSTIIRYANPAFGNRAIHTIGPSDILAALAPIWVEKHETAKRLMQRLNIIFDWARSAGHYPKENPVTGIKRALPLVNRPANHMAAMAWIEAPTFRTDLANRDSISARTLEFLILTATRSGEARGARWIEFDLKKQRLDYPRRTHETRSPA